MVFSKSLAARVRQALTRQGGGVEKKMFGGVAFLLRGNMCVGVWQDSLIVRLGPEQGARALSEPHVKAFDVTGRSMRGWAMVGPEGLDTDTQLNDWIERAVDFVAALPAK
jgi:TfoX/Sxy family transcriptional regulator of competence genes